MLRFILGLVGLGFAGVLLISFFSTLSTYLAEPPEVTAEEEFHREPKDIAYSFEGPFGRYDHQQLQRGFQVYKEVCSACHSLSLVAFRDLEAIGYSEAEVKAIANQWLIEVPSINPDTGEPETRKALPSDRFPSPYPNATAARAANNNALPPDLSLVAQSREGGPEYIDSLLTGYQPQPAALLQHFPEAKTPQGLYYNPYFANLNLAMPPPLTSDGQVTYAEGNPAPTVKQMAKDVSAFLMWAAEPKMDSRKNAGFAVVIFLLIGTVIAYFAYRNVWATEKRKVRVTGVLEPENQAKNARAKRKAGVKG